MRKFSKINEYLNEKFLGWSANDILLNLKKIPNCTPTFKFQQFISRTGDSHEMYSEEDLISGNISYLDKTYPLDKDNLYHLQYTFSLKFNRLDGNGYLYFDKGKELTSDVSIPLKDITNIFNSIEQNIEEFRDDFYVHIYQNDKINLLDFNIKLDFTSKESAEKEYFIK